MSKVLKLIQCSNLGGMEQSAYKLLPWLAERDISFTIATPRPFGDGAPFLKRVDKGAFDSPYSGRFGWKSHPGFTRKVLDRSIDCSHIWITGTDIASLRSVRGSRLPKLLGHHYHHFESSTSYFRWKLFYEVFCRQCDRVTYCSDFVRNEAIGIAPWLKNRSSVVHYHFPIIQNDGHAKGEARTLLELPQDSFVIGNAGWLIPRKRWDVFLGVAEIVLEAIPNAYFILAGGGELEQELRSRVHRMRHGARIRFLGWQKNLESFYRSLDILLFNSDFDAFGRTPGEAMGYGAVPVASVVRGGLNELVFDGKNGFLLNKHDCSQMASQIVSLCKDPSMMNEMRAAGAATLNDLYSQLNEGDFYLNEFKG